MWGSGVADDETIPAACNQLHPDFRVVNHGESGFTSRQSISALVNLGYHRPLAEKAVAAALKAAPDGGFERTLKQALRELAK